MLPSHPLAFWLAELDHLDACALSLQQRLILGILVLVDAINNAKLSHREGCARSPLQLFIDHPHVVYLALHQTVLLVVTVPELNFANAKTNHSFGLPSYDILTFPIRYFFWFISLIAVHKLIDGLELLDLALQLILPPEHCRHLFARECALHVRTDQLQFDCFLVLLLEMSAQHLAATY